MNSVFEAEVENEDAVTIPTGNKKLVFTAIHLAKIQAILELEKTHGFVYDKSTVAKRYLMQCVTDMDLCVTH